MTVALDAILLAVSRHSLRRWLLALGGFGLIPLGLLYSSIIPVPGSMDLLTIVLSARQQSLWVLLCVHGDCRFRAWSLAHIQASSQRREGNSTSPAAPLADGQGQGDVRAVGFQHRH